MEAAGDSPTYSICITHYNQGATIERSLESILTQLGPSMEVVIVDAGSDDGSLETLRALTAESERLRVLVEPGANRGEGRQRALEAARGTHIISNYDLDQEYGELLDSILAVYSELTATEGEIALRTAGNLFIAPRALLLERGGYKPLMRGEDHELTDRLEDAGVLRYLPVANTAPVNADERSVRTRIQRAFRSAKALYRIGFSPAQLGRFLYANHPLALAIVGTPIYAAGIVAGAIDGRVYTAREKSWREITEMSARPTYEEIVVPVPSTLEAYATDENRYALPPRD